jgi:4-alpha-glucanotransferase
VARRRGQASLHTLPLLERAAHERSPYSALSAFAIDPIHVGLDQVEDFVGERRPAALSDAIARRSRRLRAPRRSTTTRSGPSSIGRSSAPSRRFVRTELATTAARRRFARSSGRGRMAADYALYRALYAEHGDVGWPSWPDPALRAHDPDACAAARDRLAERVRYFAWVQWARHEQLAMPPVASRARRRDRRRPAVHRRGGAARTSGRASTSSTSACRSARRRTRSTTTGRTGRCRVPVGTSCAAAALPWLRERVGHIERWLDGARLDHIVGYFRTFVRPPRAAALRAVRAVDAARARRRRPRRCARCGGGRRLLAEDLGDVPDFVREEMAARSLPGYRVLRWENDGPSSATRARFRRARSRRRAPTTRRRSRPGGATSSTTPSGARSRRSRRSRPSRAPARS